MRANGFAENSFVEGGKAMGLLVILVAAGVLGCREAQDDPSYRQQVLQHRLEKDMALQSGDRPVLTRAARQRFKGLRYFEVDPTYRFEVPLRRTSSPDTVWMAQSSGRPMPYQKVGTVEVPLPGGPYTLSVFQPDGKTGGKAAGSQLWIPFADATTGRATYGGGRYLDVPRRDSGMVLVDFNMGYNPLCAYNSEKYSCALAPPENHLSVPVPVGEKKLHDS